MLAYAVARALLAIRILLALDRLVPCPLSDAACPARHAETAAAIATVSRTENDAAVLLGVCAHESGCRVVRQARGGPARSVFQVEPLSRGAAREEEQARLESDPVYAAQRALAAWGRDGAAYACGDEQRCPAAVAELRRYVAAARWALR